MGRGITVERRLDWLGVSRIELVLWFWDLTSILGGSRDYPSNSWGLGLSFLRQTFLETWEKRSTFKAFFLDRPAKYLR